VSAQPTVEGGPSPSTNRAARAFSPTRRGWGPGARKKGGDAAITAAVIRDRRTTHAGVCHAMDRVDASA